MAKPEYAKQFEIAAEIAWMVDNASGYRGASLREWRYESIGKLPGGRPSLTSRRARLEVQQLAEDERLPPIVIEPLANQRVLVSSEVALVVQEYGESVSRASGGRAEIPYGSVVRAGPLLFAPLYEEQADSVRRGVMTLPFIGGGSEGEAARESETELDPALTEAAKSVSKKRWPIVAALLAVLLIIGVVSYLELRPQIDPRRVLVALSGWDDEATANLQEQLSADLRGAGFEPVLVEPGEAPELGVRAADLEGLARERLAKSVLLVRLEIVEEREGLTPEIPYIVARATGDVFRLDSPLEQPPRQSVTFGGERDASRERTLERLGGDMVRVLSHGLVAALIPARAEPSFFDLVPSDDRIRVIENRRAAEDAVKNREGLRRLYEESCDQAVGGLSDDRGPMKIRYHSGPCDEEYPVAMAKDGSYVIVQTETLEPYYPLEIGARVRGAQAPERLELLNLDDDSRRTLVTAQNFLGFAGFAEDVERVFVVEKARMSYGLVEYDIRTSKRRVISVLRAPERFVSPLPSPNGRWMILWYRPNRGAPQRAQLLSSEGGARVPLPENMRSLRWIRWQLPEADQERPLIAAIHRPTEAERFDPETGELIAEVRPMLVLIDPATVSVVFRLTAEEGGIDSFIGAHEGALYYTLQELHDEEGLQVSRCVLRRFAPRDEEEQLTSTVIESLPSCPRNLTFAGDGRIVGRVRASIGDDDRSANDRELLSIDLRTGAARQLTANAIDERYLVTGSATTRIAFGRVLPTHYPHIPRAAFMTADIGGEGSR